MWVCASMCGSVWFVWGRVTLTLWFVACVVWIEIENDSDKHFIILIVDLSFIWIVPHWRMTWTLCCSFMHNVSLYSRLQQLIPVN